MADIKLRETKKGTIKTLNKSVVGLQKMKSELVQAKEKIQDIGKQEDNANDYATGRVSSSMQETPNTMITTNRKMINNYKNARQNIQKTRANLQYAKKRSHAKKVTRNIVKNSKTAGQKGKTAIKTADRIVKSTANTTKATSKVASITLQRGKELATKSVKNAKAVVKGTISSIKALITGMKALITGLIAGGWIVLVLVIVICLIGMILNSVFGIFFSSEKTSGTQKSMSSVISEINTEYINKITKIQKDTSYDEYDIESNRADWKDVLAVYATKVSNGKDETDVLTLDDKKIKTLKEVFWDMNKITSSTEKVTKDIKDENGNVTEKDKEVTILHIKISHKSVDEMMIKYEFDLKQKNQIKEILSQEYSSMWSQVIYGSSVGSTDIVAVAESQLGNVGGEPYWSWYGFKSRVEWCATFVSWCANECGYIEAGIIPKFAGCQAEGVEWFKTCGLWKDGGYTPSPRRYYIF